MAKQDRVIGTTRGIYTILEFVPEKSKGYYKVYRARCNICGYIRESALNHLTASACCTHQRLGGISLNPTVRWTNSNLRHIFNNMKRRCYNKTDEAYHWYGARGIKICDEWLTDPISFESWALANGYKKGLTIDRFDSTKDYCPNNCRWLSNADNARRAGKVNWITAAGLTMTGRQWAEYLGHGDAYINKYIRKHGLLATITYIETRVKTKEA